MDSFDNNQCDDNIGFDNRDVAELLNDSHACHRCVPDSHMIELAIEFEYGIRRSSR
jgi:hypothetical protein